MERHVGEAVIARLADDALQREADERHDRHEQDEHDERDGDGPIRAPELHQRDLTALARHRGEGLALAGEPLVDAQNDAAQQDGDERDDVALPLIARLNERAHLGGEGVALDRRAQEHRHGVGAEAGGEDQQEGREDGRHDDGDRHAADDRGAVGLEDGGALLERGVHVFEDAADEQIRERRVVQADDHDHREQAVDEPLRHADAEDGFHHADVAAADAAVLEHVGPEEGERPRGHHVGEDEHGGDELLAPEIRARHEPRDGAADGDAQQARAEGDDEGVAQRIPEVDAAPLVALEQVPKVDEREGAGGQARDLFLGAQMDGEHVAEHGDHREEGEHDEHAQEEHEQQVSGLAHEGAQPVEKRLAGEVIGMIAFHRFPPFPRRVKGAYP